MRCASLPADPFHPSRTDEVAVNGSLVTDLGLGPEVWLFLSALGVRHALLQVQPILERAGTSTCCCSSCSCRE